MKYMLFCYDNEGAWVREGKRALEEAQAEAAALCREIDGRGQYLLASPLQPVATATSVQVRNGKRMVTDGPFAETHEHLGGFGRHPGARLGTVEIRPLQELTGLPDTSSKRTT